MAKSNLPNVTNEVELNDAIQHASDNKTRAHIHEHAHRLGLAHLLPSHWKKDGSTSGSTTNDPKSGTSTATS